MPTSTGKQWTPQTLRRMLATPRISGQREHRGEIVGTAEWPAIITPAETERIRALLADPNRRTNKTARRYLLARSASLRPLWRNAVSRPRADRTRRYVCAKGPGFGGCGRITIIADHVEHAVTEAVLFRLDSPELAASLHGRSDDPAAAEWQAEAERAQAQLDELATAYAEQLIGLQEWLTARGEIEQRLQTARKKLAALNQATALDGYLGNASELREEWPTMPLSRQAAIVAATLDHAVIAPATPRPQHARPVPDQLRLARLDPAAQAPPPAAGPPRSCTFAGSPCASAEATAARESPRSASQSDHAHQTAGGLDQPSTLDERHTCDGCTAHPRAASPSTSSSTRPVSRTRSGWKPCATSYRCSPAARRSSSRLLLDVLGEVARRHPRLLERPRPVRQIADQLDVHEPATPHIPDQPLPHIPADREVDVQAVPARMPLRRPRHTAAAPRQARAAARERTRRRRRAAAADHDRLSA